MSRYTRASAAERAQMHHRLMQPVPAQDISHRQGPGGQMVPYVEGSYVLDVTNHVFGFDGWMNQIVHMAEDFFDFDGKAYHVGLFCIVRVVHRSGAYHEDLGYGQAKGSNKGDVLEKARKEAVTDAIKRALRIFGPRLGNSVHGHAALRGGDKHEALSREFGLGDANASAEHAILKDFSQMDAMMTRLNLITTRMATLEGAVTGKDQEINDLRNVVQELKENSNNNNNNNNAQQSTTMNNNHIQSSMSSDIDPFGTAMIMGDDHGQMNNNNNNNMPTNHHITTPLAPTELVHLPTGGTPRVNNHTDTLTLAVGNTQQQQQHMPPSSHSNIIPTSAQAQLETEQQKKRQSQQQQREIALEEDHISNNNNQNRYSNNNNSNNNMQKSPSIHNNNNQQQQQGITPSRYGVVSTGNTPVINTNTNTNTTTTTTTNNDATNNNTNTNSTAMNNNTNTTTTTGASAPVKRGLYGKKPQQPQQQVQQPQIQPQQQQVQPPPRVAVSRPPTPLRGQIDGGYNNNNNNGNGNNNQGFSSQTSAAHTIVFSTTDTTNDSRNHNVDMHQHDHASQGEVDDPFGFDV